MLEEIGVSPDVAVREKKPSLKSVGLAVVATVRMQKMQAAWAESKKVHDSLMRKLEGMKRTTVAQQGHGQAQALKKRAVSGRTG